MKKVLSFLLVLAVMFAFSACGADGKEGETPTIEISEDGYWVINGEKTDVSAVAKPKEFVVGEEILLNDGKEFKMPIVNEYGRFSGEYCTITTAKLVAVKEIPLEDPGAWPDKDGYFSSYLYRLYVSGYGPVENAGNECTYHLCVRLSSYTGALIPKKNYISTTIGEDGYFEYSVDLYLPDVTTKVIPVQIYK